jgi:hypothetical protein
MRTEREKAVALLRAIDSVEAVPRSPIRQLRELLARWRAPVAIGDRNSIGYGSHAALERLCIASEIYVTALQDAKAMLEIV